MIITAETQSTQRKDFLSAGRYRQTKSTLFLEFDFWPKAYEFIENRHLPILDKKIRLRVPPACRQAGASRTSHAVSVTSGR
jgi:hypothetical protein